MMSRNGLQIERLYQVIAELLRGKGTRAEPHTLENLVTHRSQKFWLSFDCLYKRSSVRQPTSLKNKREAP